MWTPIWLRQVFVLMDLTCETTLCYMTLPWLMLLQLPSFAFANFGVCQGKSIWRVCVVQSMLCIWVYSKFLHGENLRIYVVVLFGTISILALGYISSSWSCSHSPFPNQTNVVYSWIWLQRFHALESGLKAQKQGRNRLICWLTSLTTYYYCSSGSKIHYSRSQIVEGRKGGIMHALFQVLAPGGITLLQNQDIPL